MSPFQSFLTTLTVMNICRLEKIEECEACILNSKLDLGHFPFWPPQILKILKWGQIVQKFLGEITRKYRIVEFLESEPFNWKFWKFKIYEVRILGKSSRKLFWKMLFNSSLEISRNTNSSFIIFTVHGFIYWLK